MKLEPGVLVFVVLPIRNEDTGGKRRLLFELTDLDNIREDNAGSVWIALRSGDAFELACTMDEAIAIIENEL